MCIEYCQGSLAISHRESHPWRRGVFGAWFTGLTVVLMVFCRPAGSRRNPFRSLLFDSWFDVYRGVVCHLAVKDGSLSKGKTMSIVTRSSVNMHMHMHTLYLFHPHGPMHDLGSKIVSFASKKEYEVVDIGLLCPDEMSRPTLHAGQVGYAVLGMKTVKEAFVGDTFFAKGDPVEPLPGFQKSKPMVCAHLCLSVSFPAFRGMSITIRTRTRTDSSCLLTLASFY